jgi:hypothetical protein
MDFLGFVAGAFEEAEAQNLLGLAEHGYFAVHAVADVAVKLSYHVFKTGFGGGQIGTHLPEQLHGGAFVLAQDAEEQVLYADGSVL